MEKLYSPGKHVNADSGPKQIQKKFPRKTAECSINLAGES